MEKAKAVVLLSGGLDSAVCLAIAKSEGYECYPLIFNYGQRNYVEGERARVLAKGLTYKTVHLELFGGSSLLGDGEIEKGEVNTAEIPSTWVPARNLIFLSMAAAYAVAIKSQHIFIGVNSVDFSSYPDCRPAFIEAAEMAINLALIEPVTIHAPLQYLTKGEIIREGDALGVNFSKTLSCYAPVDGKSCGLCPSCRIRMKGFVMANLEDPA